MLLWERGTRPTSSCAPPFLPSSAGNREPVTSGRVWPVRELLLGPCPTPGVAPRSEFRRQVSSSWASSAGLISSSWTAFSGYVSANLCNFLIKEILGSVAVLLSTEIETCNKDGRKLFMSALFEETVACNYRRFSSLVAKTMNKCSCVTWRGATEKPLLVSLFVCVGGHVTYFVLSLSPLPPFSQHQVHLKSQCGSH